MRHQVVADGAVVRTEYTLLDVNQPATTLWLDLAIGTGPIGRDDGHWQALVRRDVQIHADDLAPVVETRHDAFSDATLEWESSLPQHKSRPELYKPSRFQLPLESPTMTTETSQPTWISPTTLHMLSLGVGTLSWRSLPSHDLERNDTFQPPGLTRSIQYVGLNLVRNCCKPTLLLKSTDHVRLDESSRTQGTRRTRSCLHGGMYEFKPSWDSAHSTYLDHLSHEQTCLLHKPA